MPTISTASHFRLLNHQQAKWLPCQFRYPGEHIDSLVIDGGEFTFTGTTDTPVLARLLVNGKRKAMFVLEPGTLSADSTGKVTGSDINERFNSFETFYRDLVGKMQALPQVPLRLTPRVRWKKSSMTRKIA